MIIIGITGTLGAGKGTIVEYLVQQRGFVHFSVREYISEEIVRRGLPVNRDNMVVVANDLRAVHSPSYIVDQLWERASLTGQNCVIESIRTPGEVISLRAKGNFILLAVDADRLIRFERIILRNSSTDQINYNTFVEDERREWMSNDPNKQSLTNCIRLADYIFNNDATKIQLIRQVSRVLDKLLVAR